MNSALIILYPLIDTSLGCVQVNESTIDRKIVKNAFRVILSVGILSNLISLLLFLSEEALDFLLEVLLRSNDLSDLGLALLCFFELLVLEKLIFFFVAL